MTYGPTLQWRFPFQERIELRKPDFRVVFISLCFAAVLIVLISFTYYTSLPVSVTSNVYQIHSRESVHVNHFSKSNASKPNAIVKQKKFVKENSDEIIEFTAKELELLQEQLKDNVDLANDNDIESANQDKDVPKATSGIKPVLEEDFNWNEFKAKELDQLQLQFKNNVELAGDNDIESASPDTDAANDSVRINSIPAESFNWNDTRLDILHMPKLQYDTRFQNPCWYERLQTADPYETNSYAPFSPAAKRTLAKLTEHWAEEYAAEDSPRRLRCLPYFLIIGQPKCGTTDLFWKIAKHPDIETPPIKELHWWSRSRQGRRFSYSKIIPFNDYVDMFDRPALLIDQRLSNITASDDVIPSDDPNNMQIITGEASVSLFWDNREWMKFPENSGRTEPAFIIPHYIHHVIPDAKLIIMLRDPVERLYSDYLYFHSTNKSADDFHSAVKFAISLYSTCITKYSVRKCVYDTDLANKVRVRISIGMYSVFLNDWLKLFPLEQFFILRLEDYSRNTVQYVKQIYKFLGIREITEEEEELIMVSLGMNVRKPEDKLLGGMHEETRGLLSDFYKAYNQELAQILGNTKFLWKDTQN